MKYHVAILLLAVGFSMVGAVGATDDSDGNFDLKRTDVVAFIGGESVVQQGETGHLESILATAFPGRGIRLRNLGWEGDTVFEQPRDLNFPGIRAQLERVKATVVFAQLGRAESLAGRAGLEAFAAAYGRLCDELAKQTPRIVLLTPAPFEKPADPRLPDLSARNADLAAYAAATVELAKRRGYACADVFTRMAAPRNSGGALTEDGRRAASRGLAAEALAVAAELKLKTSTGVTDAGAWDTPALEAVRQAVVARNKLWFDYSRPMNWAFLGGDRMSTASSRDPKDLNVRIFPQELEKFVPLIEQADAKIEELANAVKTDPSK